MKLINIASATTIVESNGVKILMDPWTEDGEYYGSWYHYPKVNPEKLQFQDVTHIYISHIHPDHFSIKTFELLNKNIPVYVHKYDAKFLKFNIERLGFKVIELENGASHKLSKDVSLTIYAADNCNPELCNKFFGCAPMETKFKSTQIDSLAVISDGNHNLLNLNDCPYELAGGAIDEVMKKFGSIDFMLVGYCGAGPYPQCFEMEESEMRKASEEKKLQFLKLGLKFINRIKPKYYMPFAGTYILSGSLSHLNEFRGIPELDEALEYYEQNSTNFESKGILLNHNEFFDVSTGLQSRAYQNVNITERNNYIQNDLKDIKYHYQDGKSISEKMILELIPKAFERFISKKNEINFKSKTLLFINISKKSDLLISFEDSTYKIVSNDFYKQQEFLVRIKLESNLLFRLLSGPRFAHWNNAEIGSHLHFNRIPNTFERGLYHCLYFLHI